LATNVVRPTDVAYIFPDTAAVSVMVTDRQADANGLLNVIVAVLRVVTDTLP
jgi:hypothetical protein